MTEPRNIRPRVVAGLDQDWAEACEWFMDCEWGSNMDAFTELFKVSVDEFKEKATDEQIDCFQRLARLAFFETWKRAFDRVAEDMSSSS